MNPMPPYSLPLPGVGPSGRGREGGTIGVQLRGQSLPFKEGSLALCCHLLAFLT